jgi:hypothetical protein
LRALRFTIVALLVARSASATVLWRGDFSTGNTSQWTSTEAAASTRVQVVTSPTPPGQGHAMQAIVVSGDSVYGGARAELDYETDRPAEGSERYYRWQTYFPADFKSANYWELFTQWHQYISGSSPPLAFMAWGESIQLGNDQDHYFWTVPLVRGVWHDFVFHVIWSSDPTKGRIELWYDGQHVLLPTATYTLFAGDTVYMKQGLYRKAAINWTQVVYHGGTVIGTTLADVMPTATASLTPNPVNFGSLRVGGSTTQTVTLKNPTAAALNVTDYSLTGTGFSVSPASAATTVAAGASATWTVTFAPTATGASSGSLTINTASGPAQATLNGTGVAPKTSVSPTSLSFGSVSIGTTSAAQTVTVSNTGTDALTISRLALAGTNATDFAFVAPTSLTVAAGLSAKISVTFHPTLAAAESASLTFTTDNGAQSVSLKGTGTTATTVPPASVSFADAFATCTSTTDLGASWTISGRWYCSSPKSRGETAQGTALAKTAVMTDTDVTGRIQLTGTATGSGVIARASGGAYYAAVVYQSGALKILRVAGGTTTVLGTVAMTVGVEPTAYNVRLHVTGSTTVQLDAFVSGAPVLSAQDASAARLLSGQAGLVNGTAARTQFNLFSVVSQ